MALDNITFQFRHTPDGDFKIQNFTFVNANDILDTTRRRIGITSTEMLYRTISPALISIKYKNFAKMFCLYPSKYVDDCQVTGIQDISDPAECGTANLVEINQFATPSTNDLTFLLPQPSTAREGLNVSFNVKRFVESVDDENGDYIIKRPRSATPVASTSGIPRIKPDVKEQDSLFVNPFNKR
ncbi:unnamed protein product [Euphydryas editha]|uniref:Uncharacterized protein n=1 Tax=Euphydryas editha TaxID=104508 RepID=A0AAU9UQH9_EUPED|nr:unnamed protein product [Euphydryas editha]